MADATRTLDSTSGGGGVLFLFFEKTKQIKEHLASVGRCL